MGEGRYFLYDTIQGDLIDFDSLEEIRQYAKDCYIEDGQIHPDIDSLMIFYKVGRVSAEETGEYNGETPICQIKIKQLEPLSTGHYKLIDEYGSEYFFDVYQSRGKGLVAKNKEQSDPVSILTGEWIKISNEFKF